MNHARTLSLCSRMLSYTPVVYLHPDMPMCLGYPRRDMCLRLNASRLSPRSATPRVGSYQKKQNHEPDASARDCPGCPWQGSTSHLCSGLLGNPRQSQTVLTPLSVGRGPRITQVGNIESLYPGILTSFGNPWRRKPPSCPVTPPCALRPEVYAPPLDVLPFGVMCGAQARHSRDLGSFPNLPRL
jgi:hypothetical protein